MSQVENRFLEYLHYQISANNSHYNSINRYFKKLADFTREFGFKEKQIGLKFKENYERMRHQVTYRSVMDEFKALVNKKRAC